jgi:hypothetical protein
MSADLELDRFKKRLGDQLEAAALRSQQSTAPFGQLTPAAVDTMEHHASGGAHRKLAFAGALLLVLVGAVALVAAPATTTRAEAEILQFNYEGDTLLVQVVDLVDDPDELRAELEAQGLNASVTATPVPPLLVGAILRMDSEPDSLSFSPRQGPIETFTLPSNYQGRLDLVYGIPADGSSYAFVDGSSLCAEIDREQSVRAIETSLAANGYRTAWALDGVPILASEIHLGSVVVEGAVVLNIEEVTIFATSDVTRPACTLN